MKIKKGILMGLAAAVAAGVLAGCAESEPLSSGAGGASSLGGGSSLSSELESSMVSSALESSAVSSEFPCLQRRFFRSKQRGFFPSAVVGPKQQRGFFPSGKLFQPAGRLFQHACLQRAASFRRPQRPGGAQRDCRSVWKRLPAKYPNSPGNP